MTGKGKFIWMALALVVAIVALAWPQIEQQLAEHGYGCPYPFSLLITGKGAENELAAEAEGLPTYTLDQLRMCVCSPCVEVLDVTSGARFYAKGKSYNQFAGTDISDDISDFDDKKMVDLEETKEFYYEKYPIVRPPVIELLPP
ncbi:hypothetical protein BBJ28_00009446 [Nothophytophthora sp. Chile5]|nr:hypothetical protein BBJ28_00009446 [Nothophytophthora sp. Chile5]